MEYSIVIATRNRLKALQLSVPRMLAQSRPPAQMIVVDSSDDHAAVAAEVRKMVGDLPIRLIIKHSERGLTLQRNIGLELVEQPIVFYPDDDSIFPGVAKEIMETYERDSKNLIAALCAAESKIPPADFPIGKAD
ncbi:MAG: glycosyltransferase [Verrucomicrobia bacterium]|nr:glycosyltransferase [Verrucomicrobiota bacterium]